MKQFSKFILSILTVGFTCMAGTSALAQDIQVSDSWGNNTSRTADDDWGSGNTSEEDALLQSLYNEEEDEDLTRMLQSEDYIFPTSITDNWHLVLQVGAMNSWGSYDSQASWAKRTNFAAAFSIGKYLSPVNDIRIQLFYGRGTGVRGSNEEYIDPLDQRDKTASYAEFEALYPYHQNWEREQECIAGNRMGEFGADHVHGIFEGPSADKSIPYLSDNHLYHWNTLGVSAAWLPNITNLIMGYDPDRKFTVSAMMGIDIENTWAYTEKNLSVISVWAEHAKSGVHRTLVGLQFGAQCDYVLNSRWHINLEANETFLDDSFDGLISDQSWDGHLNMMLGVTWFLKGKHQDGRIQNRNPFEDKYLNYTEKIYKNREAIEDALANRPDSVEIVNVRKDVTYTLISFDQDAMEVPRLQQNNVYTTAEVFRRIPGSKVFITNSNKKDDSMFHQRAWAISKLLNQRWQIPLDQVWVDADESHIQKLQVPDCKHYIIMIINEE